MQKHTSHHAGWKYTVSALALGVAMAPVAQAASVLQSTGRLELKGTPTSRMARTTGLTSRTQAAELIATKTKELAGREYTFQKWGDAKGNVTSMILDEKGNAVLESALPEIAQNILEPELEALLRTRSGRRGLHKVNVALELSLTEPTEKMQTGTVETSGSGESQLQINGRRISENDFARVQVAEQAVRQAQLIERFAERNAFVEAFAKRHNLELAKDALESSGKVLTFQLKAEQIEDLAHSGDPSIRGIELYRERDLYMAVSKTATGINPWALNFALTGGNGVGVFWAEYGCPDEDDIGGSYTRLSGTPHWHSQIVGDVLRDVSPDSTLYCRGPADANGTPTQGDLTTLNPPINIVSHSAGFTGQTTYGVADRDNDDFVYDKLIPWLNAAGNSGDTAVGDDGLIVGNAQGLNVIAVGNYDTATDAIFKESSFIGPSTGNDKPEIVAPGTNIIIDGVNVGSGTSVSAPHAAAFSANSMSQSTFQKNKPHLVKAKQMAGATDPIAGDATGITMWEIPDKTGAGGIDFLSGHYYGWNYWMHEDNDGFDALDAADGSTDEYITRQVYIPNTYDAVRIAMSWLTRGAYTFDHKNDAHAIGMDLDLNVYDPAGNLVGRSWSYDNGFEVVDFPPTTSGTYTFKINRWSNNDTANKIRLGVAVNFYNY